MPVQKTSGRDRGNMVSRSNSFIGTIKSILPTKLPWFGSSGNQADAPSKRKQVEERPESEEGARSNKRQRVDESLTEARKLPDPQSRVPQSASAYLDPPTNAFGSAKPVRVPRASPLHVRSSSAAPSRSRSRMNMSPGLVGARAQAMRMTRTQSMDPPSRYRSTSYRPALSPMPISRDASMEDLTGNDSPTSPNRPFRMRTSLTPALAEQEFGPHPTRRERDGSEPPPLAVLIENPVFVKAPSEAPRHSTPMARQGSLTLGAVVDAQRQVISG
ncbi:hypothetical protein BDW22DRAFT_393447 [Trametopsis cervina]|nr:hypothetical protein BDW22DRAFT_393447 [Trametopsis cervina]